jgi:hypothetical protein
MSPSTPYMELKCAAKEDVSTVRALVVFMQRVSQRLSSWRLPMTQGKRFDLDLARSFVLHATIREKFLKILQYG